MYNTVNTSKHDSISISNPKGHQELVGLKRDFDSDQVKYKTKYGAIYKGEKIDPKNENSDQLINSIIDDSQRENVKNNHEISEINRYVQDMISPVRGIECGSPSYSFFPLQSTKNRNNQSNNVTSVNFQAISLLDSNNNLNFMSTNKFANGDFTSKTVLEDQDLYGQQVLSQDRLSQNEANDRFSIQTRNLNQCISPHVIDICQSPNTNSFSNQYMNHQTDDNINHTQNKHKRNSKNHSIKVDHSGYAGSQSIYNKNQSSSSNVGHFSEGQNHQKSEFKKNSIATYHTRHQKQKQTNFYVLAIFCLKVIKFAKNLFYYSQMQQFKLLNQMKIKIIGDNTSYYKYYYYSGLLKKKPSIFESLKYKTRRFLSHQNLNSFVSHYLCCKTDFKLFPDFDEGSKAKIIWDIFMLIVIIFNIFASPLRHSFQTYQSNFFTTHFQSIVFALDILLQFKTSYFENGQIISKKSMIIMNYLKGKFIQDLLGLLIFILSYTAEQLLIMSYLMIYRYFGVKKIFSDIENKFQLREKGLAYSQFIQLIISILMVAHYSASIFHNLAQLQYAHGITDTWLSSLADYHSPWIERYVVSLYWSVITIITIGYGDVTPKTMIERTYVICFTFIGCGLFAYSINVIGEQIRENGREKALFKRKSAKLSKFMSLRGLNKDLQEKVRKYYEYLFHEQMNDEEEGANIFNNLTTLLKKQVWIDVYGKLLKQKPIFMANFTDDCINMLSLKVKEKKFGPEEYIFVDGDSAHYIFIIISGEVDQKGEMFGQLEFFSQQKRRSTIKTKCVTSVAYLHYGDFMQTLSQFDNDREAYYQIKDQINLYKNYSKIDLKCPICFEYRRHSTHECNSVNFIIYKDKLIQNAKSSHTQERQDRNIVLQEYLKQQKTLKNTKNVIGSLKHIPSQYKIRNNKFNAIVNNRIVKESGFCIIVNALAEQLQETLSKEEEVLIHQKMASGEMKDAQSDLNEEENQQQEISVSEDLDEKKSSEYNYENHVKAKYMINQNPIVGQRGGRKNFLLKNRSNSLNENNIHVEVSADQEESQQNMTNLQRSTKKSRTGKYSSKILNQDSDRRIEICKSQCYFDYTYALKNEINLYMIPYAYVVDKYFKFPQEVVNSVSGNVPQGILFTGSPTRFQNPISANSQYFKQRSQKSDNILSQNSSNSISPTVFQQPYAQISSNKNIDTQKVNNNTYYSNSNSNNQSPFIQLSPSNNLLSNGNFNFSNHPSINGFVKTQSLYSQSPLNQVNPLIANTFGATVNALGNQLSQTEYNNMITQNPFSSLHNTNSNNSSHSPYNNRLGTYGMYLPALQQLEPINELLSKEIISSDENLDQDGEKNSTKKSNKGSIVANASRRQSKETSINLHMKSYKNRDSVITSGQGHQGNNSQYIGSNNTIAAHHMEAISPQRVNQLSHETIPISRGFSSEQDPQNHEENNQGVNTRNKISSQQHVQFAEDDDNIQNITGNTPKNQNSQTSFEQVNPNGTQRNRRNKRNSFKPSLFSNNQYTYMNSMSLTGVNQTQKIPLQQIQGNFTSNVIYPKNSSSYYQQLPNLLLNINQGSGGQQLGSNQNTFINQINAINQNNLNNFNGVNTINQLNNAANVAANFQNQLLLANHGFSSQFSYGYDPSSLYSKLMSRQSIQFKFKKDQDFCALIYKKKINLRAIDRVYEDIYNNFDVMKNYSFYFWHNNFSQIASKDGNKFIRRKFQSTTTSKQRKASKTNETYFRNTYRTSYLFHLSRLNSNGFNNQISIPSTNKPSITSLNYVPRNSDKPYTQKTIQI